MAGLFNNVPNTSGGINYHGKNLPQQAKKYNPQIDPNNTPWLFTFQNQTTQTQFTLPTDVLPILNGKKIPAKNNW